MNKDTYNFVYKIVDKFQKCLY